MIAPSLVSMSSCDRAGMFNAFLRSDRQRLHSIMMASMWISSKSDRRTDQASMPSLAVYRLFGVHRVALAAV